MNEVLVTASYLYCINAKKYEVTFAPKDICKNTRMVQYVAKSRIVVEFNWWAVL